MFNKRGDISIGVIISIILLVIGFVILLFVYYQLNLSGTTDSQICHESVIIRGTSPNLAQDFVPLNCKTDKICVSAAGLFSKGNCDEFKNEKGITTIKVSDDDDGISQVEKVYADQILSCWSMMGEGKLSLFSSFLVSRYGLSLKDISPSCVICSRVAIDSTSFKNADLTKLNVLGYMQTHYVPSSQETYVQRLSRGGEDSAISLKFNDNAVPKIESYKNDGGEIADVPALDSKKVPEVAVMFMQITGPASALSGVTNALTDGGIAIGATALLSPKMTLGALKLVATPWGAAISAISLVLLGGYQQYSIYSNQAATATYCQDQTIGGKQYTGCSVVRTVNYKVSDIVEYCPNIESIP